MTGSEWSPATGRAEDLGGLLWARLKRDSLSGWRSPAWLLGVSARDYRVNIKAVRSEIRFGEPTLERTSIRLGVVLVCLVREIVEQNRYVSVDV